MQKLNSENAINLNSKINKVIKIWLPNFVWQSQRLCTTQWTTEETTERRTGRAAEHAKMFNHHQ